ncbi:polysaccharide deacetylase family protein [Oceanihabitans sp. 2_MG-2023]|uniref:polysaccharide deacetylase family protein n=1 Tax=Oceanihabitans sp. 2_MG-2023 TaxID=3062661 RepID=UPI0026E44149|nr:polysaccharide deacetylase family protein [Oceanihabitans sp. 2_MG-2023]MDO6596386.1 polysaccharide deacetylase family protein [Oceanihabitans sp. 2_MG-2023]
MNFTPVKTPLIVQKLFSKYTWKIASNTKEIYLTFDDGPTPEITNWVLDLLKQYNAKATFFCIGNNIEKHPEIFQDIITQGHTIGNHTHNHVKGWKTSVIDYLENVQLAQNVIHSKIKSNTKLFRPPYGQITPKQGTALINIGYKIIMWTVLSIDWDSSISRKTSLKNVITKAKSGNIIVFHDSIKASKNMQYALPKVLEHFSKKGYLFKSIS